MIKTDNKKETIRANYLNIRKNITNKVEKSLIIMKKLAETDEFKNAKTIALYKSLTSEVDTDYILKYAINNNKTIVLPRVFDDKLLFYKTKLNDTLEKSNFGIEEPIDDKNNLVSNEDIELIIVPGVCFDLKRNRLGFGGGYYDRFLENKHMNIIGICFDEQISLDESIPATDTDVKMHKIITESYIIDE